MAEFVPADAMQLNEHNGENVPDSKSGTVSKRFQELTESLYRRGMEFDVVEEWMVEEYGEVTEGNLRLGKQEYPCVIFGEDCLWEKNEIPKQLQGSGTGYQAKDFRWRFLGSGQNQVIVEQEGVRTLERGNFRVESMAPWESFDGRQMVTKGHFRMVPAPENEAETDCGNLIVSGYPFMGEPVTVGSLYYIGENGNCRLEADSHIHADAARVFVDGVDKGFCWAPDWTIGGLEEGIHRVEAKLIPSTYNTYGPHHYYLGDYHVVSPDQYSGRKNFADAPGAPNNTSVEEWHFVKFGIGAE